MFQGRIPVVQGVAVPSQHQQSTKPGDYAVFSEPLTIGSGITEYNGAKGEAQPNQFHDVVFAVAFWAHIAVMLYFLVATTGNGGNNENNYDYSGILYCSMTCGVFSLGLSIVAFGFMMQFASTLIKMALFFSIGLSLAVGIIGAMSGQIMMAIMGLVAAAFGCCYAYFVWARIPFAAANLNTALTAVKANLGLTVVSVFFLFVALGWCIWWSVAAGGAMNSMGTGAFFLFLVSYYWTHQVIQNTVHVTTAGVIGTWWHVPDEASSSIKDSFIRATTYSFGSICFGSLLVALVQALRHLQHALRDNDDFNFLLCIVDCILGMIQAIIEYLNKFAYVYVGLYGYSYLEAGKNVITLFTNKGWTAIITDDLVDNVLLMMSVAIGLISGLIGLLLAAIDNNLFAGIGYEDDGGSVGFLIGIFTGFVLASTLMSVVGSAVNTVIVCFAEAPAEFQLNHPQLSNEMRAAWTQAWPAECGNM